MLELKQKSSPLFVLAGLVMFIITLMASWWLYLLVGMSNRLQILEGHTDGPNMVRLIMWEGSTFILLLMLIFIFFIVLFYKDVKKNKSIHAFFAGLTHELKTPLASIRLQSEVLQDEAAKLSSERLDKLTTRLIDDTKRLETQMDKILQLSRIERGGNLNLRAVNVKSLFSKVAKLYAPDLDITLDHLDESLEVLADEFALEIILKNLVENTRNHTTSKKVQVSLIQVDSNAVLTYQDSGLFQGNAAKLGNLFYKYNSSKGSGIGLYLSKKFLKRMRGEFEIIHNQGLKFIITLPVERGEISEER